MWFADSAGTRCALVLSTLSTLLIGGAVGLTWSARADREVPRGPVHRMHGCGANEPVARAEPPREDPYVATLRSARVSLEHCMAKHPDVQVRLSIDITASGLVENVEVKSIAKDLASVDLKMVKCVETAVTPLRFPAAADPKRISTFLKP